jgi:5-methylcytosine-specific restriction endonuclease McrA
MDERDPRRKYIKKAIKTKRYIRGVIQSKINDSIRSRDTGMQTTDPKIRSAVLKKTGGVCYICFRKYGTADQEKYSPTTHFSQLQIDHIVPFSKGGPNHIGNYMPICGRCNRLKSADSIGDTKQKLRKIRER